MAAPTAVQDLVERFHEQREAYRSGRYNETQLRREFLDPFFKALGWDVDNEQGYAEAYKDVIHEDQIKVGGATKAPDYCFRIGGARKFFVEAKKPSVSLKDDPEPAYQLRRYAWSAKLPLSILTDFEEFSIYDCRVRPALSDKASAARTIYATFDEYAARWDEIAAIFSKEAVCKGSFDKYAEGKKARRGTAEVDTAFLAEIEAWREALAHNLAPRNLGLSNRELNFAVQMILDRIIFLRIAEDRGLESYGQLKEIAQSKDLYANLVRLFITADSRYNSGLFHFQSEKGRAASPDTLTPSLKLDDKVLKDILRNLYYPESPYEFSVLPVAILGSVYERFLGKVIRLTAGHRAVVEEKPEVRKAGGVYYTPTYIVEYIVKQTVGERLKEEKIHPRSARRGTKGAATPHRQPPEAPRICDPACGSGSFLLGAYEYLLRWYRDWYAENGAERWAKGRSPRLFQGAGGEWRLTTAERKRLLLEAIYGVDIDPQAVEVTKLSLLLKVLEGESPETIEKQLSFFKERALPDLGDNIKCGNSLIGTDFYANTQGDMFDEEERMRINAFDWEREYRKIFHHKGTRLRLTTTPGQAKDTKSAESGGFDVVIGNPPYVRIQSLPGDVAGYLTQHYESAVKNCDIYVSFIEQGYKILNSCGMLGEILPNKFFRTDYGEGLRRMISSRSAVCKIVDFGAAQVFEATTYTCLLFLSKQVQQTFLYAKSEARPAALAAVGYETKNLSSLGHDIWLFSDRGSEKLMAKIAADSARLLDLPASMSRGSSSGDDTVFLIDEKNTAIEKGILREPVFATDFGRYQFSLAGDWRIIYPYVFENGKYRLYGEKELRTQFPRAYAYLLSHQTELRKRKQYREWFGYSAPRNLELHDRAQIIIPLLAEAGSYSLIPKKTRGRLCPMASGGFTLTLGSTCRLAPEYVLGLINSRLLFWRLRQMSNVFRGGWITCTKQYFGELPIRLIDFPDAQDKARHDRILQLVDQMLSLHKSLAATKTEHEKTVLQRQIDATDEEIDRLVYELYELTPDEIRIVEEG